MLHQDLPTISARPIDSSSRWVVPALGAAALLSAAIIYFLFGAIPAAVLTACVLAGAAAGAIMLREPAGAPILSQTTTADFSLVGAGLSLSADPAAITSADGALLSANEAYRERFIIRRLD
jgi:two-component system, cell cycle sensor histidine kinase and response regulator CckA